MIRGIEMRFLSGNIQCVFRQAIIKVANSGAEKIPCFDLKMFGNSSNHMLQFNSLFYPSSSFLLNRSFGTKTFSPTFSESDGTSSLLPSYQCLRPVLNQSTSMAFASPYRNITTVGPASQDPATANTNDLPPRIKFKRLDKTARHIMQILDKEAVEDVKSNREIPDIRPGYIVQLKVEVPENKRRASVIKGIVIARRNAGLNTTFRIRRTVAGVGIESLFHLYSPNIKEIKVLDKKKVRRAKLYYLRDKMNPLKK